MTISSKYLNHRVSIVRKVGVLDEEDEPTVDDYGQPVRVDSTLASNVAAGIQPKSARERAQESQAGIATATHKIYMLPRDVSTADQILHNADDCPAATDLPTATYQVTAVPDAVGAGHHLELSAVLVGGPALKAYETPVGSGS